MSEPWKDWIPGVLSKDQVKQLCRENYLENVANWDDNKKSPIDHSSVDLTLANEGYEIAAGSIKPGGFEYRSVILENRDYAKPLKLQKDETFLLKKGRTYLFRLNETLKNLKETRIYGQATAKSSIGRLDVLARLIVDGMDCYEHFKPEYLKEGSVEIFVEISPITFNVRVKPSISLTQLRLFYGSLDDAVMRGTGVSECVLQGKKENSLSVDLSETEICEKPVSAFRAKDQEENDFIDLWVYEGNNENKKPKPEKYWECLLKDQRNRLQIKKGCFYILRSKERISLPKGVAVYCRATDETIGEMRIHYAGFAHPFFGKNRKDGQEGTPLIFEVRGHNVDVSLRDGEKMANITFYRMSEDCKEPEQDKDEEESIYNEQILQLSKIFAPWQTISTS